MGMAALRLALIFVLAALMLAAAPVAGAIVGGVRDTRASHDYVVFVGQISEPRRACTGILVDATTVVTAGHCGLLPDGTAPDLQPFMVFQGPNLRAPLAASPGVFYGHDDFAWDRADGVTHFPQNDLAVVKLLVPLPGPYAALPPAGSVDALGSSTRGEVVGFGVQALAAGHLPMFDPYGNLVGYANGRTPLRTDGSRMRGDAKLADGGAIDDAFVKVSSGACRGDSGGPVIVDGVSIGVLSFTHSPCNAVTYATRLDTAASLEFLAGFGVTP